MRRPSTPGAEFIATAWPLAVLCLAASTLWLLTDRFPQIVFDLRSAALAAFLAGMLSAFRPRNRDVRVSASIGGALVLLGPIVGILLNAQNLSPGGLTIALALTPVVIAVAAPALTNRDFSPTRLWPGIVAAAALLIATPSPSLGDFRGDATMLLAPLLTGVGCVLYSRSSANSATPSFAITAAVLTIAALLQHAITPISYEAVGIEAALFLLALLSLRRLTAQQYASRFALIPLLLLIEGPIFVGVALINTRTVLCTAGLLIASIALLRPAAEENVSEDSLRLQTFQR